MIKFNRIPIDPLYISPEKIPSGVKYSWVRLGIINVEYTWLRLKQAKDKGWNPVPLSRHPEYFDKKIYKNIPSEFKEYIFLKKLILCERSKELCALEEDFNHKEIMKAINTIPNLDHILHLTENMGISVVVFNDKPVANVYFEDNSKIEGLSRPQQMMRNNDSWITISDGKKKKSCMNQLIKFFKKK